MGRIGKKNIREIENIRKFCKMVFYKIVFEEFLWEEVSFFSLQNGASAQIYFLKIGEYKKI